MPGPEVEGGVPVIKVRNYSGRELRPNEVIHISHEIDAQYQRSRVRAGDILLAIRGSTGDIAIVPSSLDGANITQDTARIRLADGVDRDYVYYALKAPEAQEYIRLHTIGQAVKGINIRDVRQLPIYWPSAPERRQVAAKLRLWTQAITLTERLIAAKQQLRRGLMQQLLTGKRRFPGFSEPWREVRLGEVLREVSRPVRWDEDAQYRLVSVRRGSQGLFHRTTSFGRDIKTKDLYTIESGDFLMSKRQVSHGATALTTPEFHGANVSGSYSVLRTKGPESLDIEFFAWLAKLPRMVWKTYITSNGVHIEKLFFVVKDYLKQQVRIPLDIEEQRKIVARLKAQDRELTLLQSQLTALKTQKRGLMQQLLTGKIRVPLPPAGGMDPAAATDSPAVQVGG